MINWVYFLYRHDQRYGVSFCQIVSFIYSH